MYLLHVTKRQRSVWIWKLRNRLPSDTAVQMVKLLRNDLLAGANLTQHDYKSSLEAHEYQMNE